ncbi:MAG TPA: hypothetical protein VGE02_16020 [Gemmatimonadales bacterium]
MRTINRSFFARRTILRALAALVLAGLPMAAVACSSSQQEAGADAAPEKEPTTVMVENRSFLDHNIYVMRGSQRIRLGTVTGNRSQRFTIPANLVFGVSSLRFMADPIGANRQPVSDEIGVSEGDEVRLVIPPA